MIPDSRIQNPGQNTSGKDGRKTIRIALAGKAKTNAEGLLIELSYEIYPDLPLTRKWIAMKNTTAKEVAITDLEWENINLEMASPSWIPQISTFADVYANYGQSVHKPPYHHLHLASPNYCVCIVYHQHIFAHNLKISVSFIMSSIGVAN